MRGAQWGREGRDRGVGAGEQKPCRPREGTGMLCAGKSLWGAAAGCSAQGRQPEGETGHALSSGKGLSGRGSWRGRNQDVCSPDVPAVLRGWVSPGPEGSGPAEAPLSPPTPTPACWAGPSLTGCYHTVCVVCGPHAWLHSSAQSFWGLLPCVCVFVTLSL